MGELDVWDGIRDEQDRALAAATRARAGRRGRRRRSTAPSRIQIVGDTGKLDKTLDQTQAKVGGFGADIGGTALKVAGMATVAGAAALCDHLSHERRRRG